LLAEEFQRELQAFVQAHLRLPAQNSARLADVGAPLPGVVLRQGLESDGHLGPEKRANALGSTMSEAATASTRLRSTSVTMSQGMRRTPRA